MSKVSEIRKLFLEFFVRQGHKCFPSSSLITEGDGSLLFTNAGMVPFKQAFISGGASGVKTAVSSQKCLRAGGKHNDLENVGHTNRHHTFFEMLGNFSFGDYFKERAIELAWDFVTKELSLARDRLWITVYSQDQEAFEIWKKVTGFSDERIIKISTDDNFWSMGDTGPCGPCSEIFYDYGAGIPGGLPGTSSEDGPRFTEIWNLVFMQFCKDEHGELHTLPHQCIDTGMGLERIAAVVQGVCDNYDIDLFRAIIEKSCSVFGNKDNLIAHRVIADHIRAAAFLIAEGLVPGNEGRNYVLRRIMRRAIRYAYQIDSNNILIHKVVPVLTQCGSAGYMGDAYPELARAEKSIIDTMKLEEEGFVDTLRRGMVLLEKEIATLSNGDLLQGDIAFRLYDTFGFPLDITMDIAKERGLVFDYSGFVSGMDAQRERSRKHWAGSGATYARELWEELLSRHKSTRFVGYDHYTTKASVLSILQGGREVKSASVGDEVSVLLDISPFYAESGGQEGDTGLLTVVTRRSDSDIPGSGIVEVLYTKKILDLHVHTCVVKSGSLYVNDVVDAIIDDKRRAKLRANHSATHMLHEVLRMHVDGNIQQKGSLVSPEKLRFDFSYMSALTKEQVLLVEKIVNRMIRENQPVLINYCSFDEALQQGSVALFGEKYDSDSVRVVNIGDSKELCCGTHVRCTGDIGAFRILSESGISLGVRRIEAITGEAVVDSFRGDGDLLLRISECMGVPITGVTEKLEKLLQEKRELNKKLIKAWHNIIESGLKIVNCGSGVMFCFGHFGDIPVDVIADFIMKKREANKIFSLYTTSGNRTFFVIGVGDALVKVLKASDLVRLLDTVQGKGGGSAGLAKGSVESENMEKAVAIIRDKVVAAFTE